tara:strand:+ start:2891 stop:4642 length:1752 start_codon:yes stop_codon:yes gene_type:complete
MKEIYKMRMRKINQKKAQSLMLSYVILISIVIAISIGVFTWLKYAANVTPPISCKEGTSVILEGMSYSSQGITLALKNNGRFNVGGIILTVSNETELSSPTYLVASSKQNSGLDAGSYFFNSKLKPGDSVYSYYSNTSKALNGTSGFGGETDVNLSKMKALQIQPFIYDERGVIVCQNSLIKQELDATSTLGEPGQPPGGCQVDSDCVPGVCWDIEGVCDGQGVCVYAHLGCSQGFDGCCPFGCTALAGDDDCASDCSVNDVRFCQLNLGVCEGKQEICSGGSWPGCNYWSIPYYESNETSCSDGLDNDCHGDVDCNDEDCYDDDDCDVDLGTPIEDCMDIYIPGKYYLSEDFIWSSNRIACIYINVSDVFLDGRGNEIFTQSDRGILIEGEDYSNRIDNIKITNVNLKMQSNLEGILIRYTDRVTISYSNFTYIDSSYGEGVDAYYNDYLIIENNRFINLGTSFPRAIWVYATSVNPIIRYNIIENPGNGIIVSYIGTRTGSRPSDPEIYGNIINNSWYDGIYLYRHLYGTIIHNNQVCNPRFEYVDMRWDSCVTYWNNTCDTWDTSPYGCNYNSCENPCPV